MHVVNAQCRCAVPVVSQSQPARAPATPLPPRSSLLARLRSAAAATSLAAALALAPLNSAALAQGGSSLISNAVPVVDLARVVPSERLEPLNRQLLDLEQATGWRVRMLTRYGPTAEPTLEQLRDGWSVDDKTVVVFVDPSCAPLMRCLAAQTSQFALAAPLPACQAVAATRPVGQPAFPTATACHCTARNPLLNVVRLGGIRQSSQQPVRPTLPHHHASSPSLHPRSPQHHDLQLWERRAGGAAPPILHRAPRAVRQHVQRE